MGFKHLVQFVKDGEQVKAGTPNRPLRDIDSNTRFLLELIEAANLGATITAFDVTLEASTLKGMPVYFDPNSQSWKRALAAVEVDIPTGQLVTSDSALVWGVVFRKESDTLGDILIAGFADLDFSAALADGEEIEAGQYYLSGVTAGRLVRQRPPVSVPVLKADGNGKVLVLPQWQAFLDDHRHFLFNLTAAPAGVHTPPAPGERHVITSPDASLKGWLPASHASFNGRAPAGALFGYNIAADGSLANAWPPIPTSNAIIELDKGEEADQGFHGVPMGSNGLAVVNRDGIWWMSDCYGDVPWPRDLDTGVSDSVSESVSECPRDLHFAVRLFYTKMSFLTDNAAVTSLVTDDERIEIVCQHDESLTASTGPLLIRLKLEFLVGDDDVQGFLAFKTFDAATGTFHRGPVVSGVYAASNNVTLTGEATTTQEIDDEETTVYHGNVGITVQTQGGDELDVSLVRLEGATEEKFQGSLYLELPAGEQTSFLSRIEVPRTLDIVSPELKIRLRLLGRTAGTLPALTVTYLRLTAPTDFTADEVALPSGSTAVVISTARVITTANNYVEVESDPFTVAAGDQIFVEITRSDADAYAGAVGVLAQKGILVAA